MTTRQIQDLLDHLKYGPLDNDDIFGSDTQEAVRKFQRAEGLSDDGIPGSLTQAKLLDAVAHQRYYTAAEEGTTHTSGQPPDSKQEPQTGGYPGDKYLRADGFYHIPRGVNVQLTKNFWSSEIHCQGVGCCTESVISKRIMDTSQEIRDDLGEPLEIGGAGGSGYRCPAHNKAARGAARSLHLLSEAVDLHYKDPAKLKTVALRHVKDGEIGLYSWGCHVGRWDRGYVSEFYK